MGGGVQVQVQVGLGTEGEAGHVPGMVRARDAGVALVVFHRSIVHLYIVLDHLGDGWCSPLW